MSAVLCGHGSELAAENDWLLIELAEPVEDRAPIPLPDPGRVPIMCESVFSIAHPLGHWKQLIGTRNPTLPSTWITGPRDLADYGDALSGRTFDTTIDAMLSMSGAPIFDLESNLIGLHVAGFYYENAEGDMEDCQHCPPWGCKREKDYGKAITLAHISEELREIVDP